MVDDPALKMKMVRESRAQAEQKFGGDLFCAEYRKVLTGS